MIVISTWDYLSYIRPHPLMHYQLSLIIIYG
jgi:hypothetical protein